MLPLTLQQVDELTADVAAVIAPCLYNPTPEKLNVLMRLYKTDPNRSLYACVDGDSVFAIIGLKRNPTENTAVILHIAVTEERRGQGVGRQLIDDVLALHSLAAIQAETDREAVAFYRSCGFAVESLGEVYPGVERFLCMKKNEAGLAGKRESAR
ncbi:N-acetyltransferase [Brevibacillus agri]|uniref:N-acetyltransferase n=1 Tax=Brevibacillus agri TaxID=51101 RepID=A0A3M8AWC5_9BACL|nr:MULTISPECIES: GNAT family N-acetyltransferase [Brevibacillus]EJL43561.1 acetyltransferase [Brevibacillus sp. CF112]MBY0053874.1 GNAT family N-acetyltransferase [Brevibacillus agri]MDR9505741.1 GNAT family N-acetyltransferase [Brevibacillus agri]MED1642901.1 GNAT family N-acetyltransferase [Brevibacillus agri]MED1652665.1 GNAT family N-acetyltransferase [Brevibacillus agri]